MPIGFGTLVAIVLAGLGGPLLGGGGRWFIPVVVGELLAGIIAGPAVLGAIDPTSPTLELLAEIGFAMLMLTVGMHLPLRDPRLFASLRRGGTLAGLVALLSVPAGIAAAAIAGTGHAAVYAAVIASGSAAVLLPALQEGRLASATVMVVMAQVTVADVITIVSVPIVLEPSRAGRAVLASLLVTAVGAALLLVARPLERQVWVHRFRKLSKERQWALDLRISLLVLFALAWLAKEGGTSVLVAGFTAGVMVAVVGGPKRLSTQMRGVADGFFVPLFFVLLGARLDLGGLFERPSLLALAGTLLALNVAARLLAALLRHESRAGALAASAQLGVPAAVASLGLAEHAISPATATAIVASALASLGVCTLGVQRLAAAGRAEKVAA
jgi:Kef-type K+ transport system membrane component KefB